MSTYIRWPATGVPSYPTLSQFPTYASDGSLAVAQDTDNLYVFNGATNTWLLIGGPGSVGSIGPFGSTPNAAGGVISGGTLTLEPADATHPGGVSTTTQSFGGNKTFTGTISASNLSGTNTGDVTLGTADGLSLSGQILSLGLSSASTTGALSSADWNTFNSKQPSGAYITSLTGDVTASGPGAAASTIAKIQGTTVSGTTGSTNVVFSASPTLTGTTNVAALSASGIINAVGGVDLTSPGTLAIGTSSNATTINIGNAGATVNIQGTVITETTTTLNVTNPVFTVNHGGGAGSASNSGMQVEEGGLITGYSETSADRNSWILKAPNTAGIATITPGAGGITLNQSSHNPVTIGTANGLSLATQALSLGLSSTSTTGALSSTDWNTFNGKTSGGITSLTGGVTASGPGAATATVITNANLTGPITSVGNATSIASQTGTGTKFVVDTSPTLVTPNIGAATGTSLQLSGLTASQAVATDSSKNLVSVATTGTGNYVLATSPSLTSPNLDTPTTLVGTNITGTGAGFTAGNVTTNANLTGPITSVGNATSIASQTGTGTTFAMSASPTFTGTVVAPLIAGGTTASSTLTLESTTGVGTTDSIVFSTGSQSQAMAISTIQQITMGSGAANASDQVNIAGTSTLSNTTQRALHISYTGNASATANITGIISNLFVPASTTVAQVINYSSASLSVGTGAVTRFTGYRDVAASLHPGTNNAAFTDNTNFTGNWFINQTGTDPSAFGGAITGGGGASSTLTLESTTGVGTTDSIVFKTGSQVTALTLATSGNATFAQDIFVNGNQSTMGTTADTGSAKTVLTIQGSTTGYTNAAGLFIKAGTSSSDFAMIVANAGNTVNLMTVLGSGTTTFAGRVSNNYNGAGGGFTSAPATNTGAATFEASNLNNVSYFGNESSVGGTTLTGSTAYATIVGNNSAQPMQFFTNNVLRATIDTSGNMGVGIAPQASNVRLTVNTAASGNSALDTYENGTRRFRIISSSDVELQADGAIPMLFFTNGSQRMGIDSSGVVTIANLAGTGSRAVNASATGVLSAASDSRLKTEVPSTPLPGLAEIMQIQPKAYMWNDDIAIRGQNAAVEIGFFADQVKPIIPSAAPMGNDGYYGFYDRSVTAALVKAVQELSQQVKDLQAKLGV